MNNEKDRLQAKEIIGNVNCYAEDNGELSISAFGPLATRIAEALTTARQEERQAVWEKAIEITRNAHAQYRNQSSLREAIIDALESAQR